MAAWAITAQAINVPLGSSWSVNAGALIEDTVQISSNTASGYTYFGQGTTGNFPGTTMPDSRKRPKVYNSFSATDMSVVGSTLTMTYDILWLTESPSNESQDWRFGFVSTTANGGLGTTVGANFDIGNLSGTTYYEFYVDPEVNPTSTASGVPANDMDFAFTGTNNSMNIPDVLTDQARIAQSQNDPFNTGDVDGDYNDDQIVDAADFTVWRDNDGTSNTLPNDPTPGTVDMSDYNTWVTNFGGVNTEDIVAFNDITDTHRVELTLTRIVDGYDISMNWTNLDQMVGGMNPTISHSATFTTTVTLPSANDPLGAAQAAASITSFDRLGFFINADDNRIPGDDLPWEYIMSNVSVDHTVPGPSTSVPEPGSLAIALLGLACFASHKRRATKD